MNNYKLSICLAGKNDDYAGNFLQRIELSLNKIIENLTQLKITDVEIIVTDWSSPNDAKLSDVLKISKYEHLKFIYVPEEISKKYSPESNFPYALALNVANRRSTGDYILIIDSDTYIPLDTFLKLYILISENENDNNIYYQASRFHIPYKIHSTASGLNEIDHEIEFWKNSGKPVSDEKSYSSDLFTHDKADLSNFGGACCATLLSRKILEDTTFFWEIFKGWGYLDIEFHNRVTRYYNCNGDLEDALNSEFFHLNHHVIKAGGTNGVNLHKNSPNLKANGEDWGLGNENLTLINYDVQ